MLRIKEFTTEYRKNPVGIDAKSPRFSWKLCAEQKGTMQTAYRLQVFYAESGKAAWDSGRVEREASICVPYEGEPLRPKQQYTTLLQVWDNHGQEAAKEASFETGLMTWENMEAGWITHGFEADLEPAAVFEKRFVLRKKPQKVRLYASALGVYEFTLNGRKTADIRLAPGWTCYGSRLQYQTYDLTPFLSEENEIRFMVGNGWYKGILGFYNTGNHYGDRTALIAQIDITYEDGKKESVVTDESWISTTGPVRYSEWYHGEIIDYSRSEFPATSAVFYAHSKEILVAQECEPVRITQRIAARRMLVTPKGECVLDFGQNLAGVVEARVKLEKGTRLFLFHGEALDEKGNFYADNLRTAKAMDTFICSGGEDFFLPRFTSHGFRYVKLEINPLGEQGQPLTGEQVRAMVGAESFTACVHHTDLAQTGAFSCDNQEVNRLWENIDRTMRSNYIDIPTDCPQRDERLGYTGDAQLFLSTAAYHKNVALFFEKWQQDLKTEQGRGNGIPTAVPDVMNTGGGISIWHDAGTVIPWTLYQVYGDKKFLEEQFSSMKACVEFTRTKMTEENGLIQKGQQLGDWVALDVERGPMTRWKDNEWNLELNEKIGMTDRYFVANVYYAQSIRIVAQSAVALGNTKEAECYEKLYTNVLAAIRKEYFTATGRMVSESQTGCALALHYGIAKEKDRERILKTLLSNLEAHKNHLTTGFAGTRVLCRTLSENGAHDVAGTVFLKEDCPSWLYSVKLGATTVWELWDGVNPDGSFNPFEMNSLNQYAYASIGDWMFRELAGLSCLEPGYKKSRIAPRLIMGITSLQAKVETVYGMLACEISCQNGRYQATVEVPVNTTAVVSLPGRKEEELGSGVYHYEYDTTDDFVKARYHMECRFRELLENPAGKDLFERYAPELMENELFLTFARERPIREVCAMLPSEVMPLIEMIMKQCNASVI